MIKKEQTASTAPQPQARPRTDDPHIIYEDTQLIVLSKPAGLLSQGEHKGEPNLVDWLRVYLGRPYVGLIHRLDRNTSGIMIVAKRTKAAQRLTLALQEDKIQRTYLAWLLGTLTEEKHWTHYLKKSPRLNKVSVVSARQGKKCSLKVKPLKHSQWNRTKITLAQFSLETGRSHQIRVQSAHEGYPLLGDQKYGSSHIPGSPTRVALHSHRLEFFHPISGQRMIFEDPLPSDLSF